MLILANKNISSKKQDIFILSSTEKEAIIISNVLSFRPLIFCTSTFFSYIGSQVSVQY